MAPMPALSSTSVAWPNVRLHSSSMNGRTNAIRKKSNRSRTAPNIVTAASTT